MRPGPRCPAAAAPAPWHGRPPGAGPISFLVVVDCFSEMPPKPSLVPVALPKHKPRPRESRTQSVERRSKEFNQEEFFNVRTNINIERWKKFIYSSNKGGSLIYLSKAGHFVHRDDPKAFIHHIKFMVETLND